MQRKLGVMRIVLTKNDELGSALIRWGTGEPVSHLGVVFDESLLIHASFTSGCQAVLFQPWAAKNVVVKSLKPKEELSLEQEERLYRSLLAYASGRYYDHLAVIWLGYRYALRKFFDRPIPEVNPWDQPYADYCGEIILGLNQAMSEVYSIDLGLRIAEVSTLTPWQMGERLLATGVFYDA